MPVTLNCVDKCPASAVTAGPAALFPCEEQQAQPDEAGISGRLGLDVPHIIISSIRFRD
jgi:hypothetical protein